MASPARHLFLVALVAVLAVAAEAWGGGRFFFSKTTLAETTVEHEKAAAAGSTTPDAADPNAAPAFSRPSTGGSGRGYGLYGRPEENYPPNYFRRGVHRNAEKLTTAAAATDVPAATRTTEEAAVPAGGGRGERGKQYPEDGSGRGRRPTNVPATTSYTEEEEAPARGAGDLDGVQPYPEDGSGRGRPPWYYTAFRGGRRQQGQDDQQRDYGMSDTRLYQNGRYYYDVDAGRYGYGRESNPMRTRPDAEEFTGSGYGRPAGAGGGRRGGYGNAAAGYPQYGNDDVFKNGAMDQTPNGFQEEGRNGRYIP
ncbi:translation initiation factor IF-2-like [Panicum miliaceum]|uniref:Translation initiation factor IF-2-like n=1 Tax=Panicum miliaceum TaxID=4540 RepID=A0A3L6QYD7_PANMI|nr:translation initiation factor IF-2-like [Panicum miliaceum]